MSQSPQMGTQQWMGLRLKSSPSPYLVQYKQFEERLRRRDKPCSMNVRRKVHSEENYLPLARDILAHHAQVNFFEQHLVDYHPEQDHPILRTLQKVHPNPTPQPHPRPTIHSSFMPRHQAQLHFLTYKRSKKMLSNRKQPRQLHCDLLARMHCKATS